MNLSDVLFINSSDEPFIWSIPGNSEPEEFAGFTSNPPPEVYVSRVYWGQLSEKVKQVLNGYNVHLVQYIGPDMYMKNNA